MYDAATTHIHAQVVRDTWLPIYRRKRNPVGGDPDFQLVSLGFKSSGLDPISFSPYLPLFPYFCISLFLALSPIFPHFVVMLDIMCSVSTAGKQQQVLHVKTKLRWSVICLVHKYECRLHWTRHTTAPTRTLNSYKALLRCTWCWLNIYRSERLRVVQYVLCAFLCLLAH